MDIFNDPNILLNKIVLDLQPIITEYCRTFPMFVIGPYTASYNDYRIVALCDVDQLFIDALSKFYKENKGVPCIADCQGSIINGYNCIFHLDNHILRSPETVIKNGDLVYFITLYHDSSYLSHHMNEIEVVKGRINEYVENVALFVKWDYSFYIRPVTN